MQDAYFAGRVFAACKQDDGYRFLLWSNAPAMGETEGMQITSTHAVPLEDAFLCQLESGWLLVGGLGKYDPFRHTFQDDSPQAAVNAQAMQLLGIPVLPFEEANRRVQEDGKALYSITAEEAHRHRGTGKHG